MWGVEDLIGRWRAGDVTASAEEDTPVFGVAETSSMYSATAAGILQQQLNAARQREVRMGTSSTRTTIAVDTLKALIATRGVAVETDGLDDALVAQAYKYADALLREQAAHEARIMSASQGAASPLANPHSPLKSQMAAAYAPDSGRKW